MVTLMPRNGESWERLSDQAAISLDDPVFTTNPSTREVKDVFLSLHPGESKAIHLTLGIDDDIFSKRVETLPTKLHLYYIIPLSQQVFRGDVKARAMFWEGPIDTGEITLTRER